MIALRDTSIREISTSNLPSKDSSYFRNSVYNNSGTTIQSQLPSTLTKRERDCSSPYLNNPISLIGTEFSGYTQLLGSRENNSIILRDSGNIQQTASPRIASNRFLATGLDQRIIKQSSEDCRRLLQQVG